jgi:hypothetical protein
LDQHAEQVAATDPVEGDHSVDVRSSAGGGCDAASLEFYRHRDEIELLLAVAGSPAATIQEQPAWSRSIVRLRSSSTRRCTRRPAQEARQLRALGSARP